MPWWAWVLIVVGLVGFVALKSVVVDRWLARRKSRRQEPEEE